MGSQGVLLGQRKRWRRVPPSNNFAIDWTHPVANGLAFLWLPGLSPIPQHGCDAEPTYLTYQANGRGTKWGTGSDQRAYFAIPATSPLHGDNFAWPMTIGAVRRHTTYANTSSGVQTGLVANLTAAPPYIGLSLTTNVSQPYLSFSSTTNLYQIGFASTAAAGLTALLGNKVHVGTVASGAQQLFTDGVRTNTGTQSLASKPTMAAAQFALDCEPTVSARTVNNTTSLVAIWTRVLTNNEIVDFSADPFCFLRY